MLTIRRLIEAKKAEREENGEAGFSLIELIIVVVILGILVAVAIPIFANIQTQAQENALRSAAANGATAASSALAKTGGTAAQADTAAASAGATDITVAGNTPATVDAVCVTATGFQKKVSAGPACTAAQKVVSAAP